MVKTGLFNRIIEAIDIVAEERIACQELLESFSDLTKERRVVLDTQKVTDKDTLHCIRHPCQPGGRPGKIIYIRVLELRIDRPRVDGVAAE